MFGNKAKNIERLEKIVKNQDNLINNTNNSLTLSREEAEALRSRNRELTQLLVNKDIAIDKLEQKAASDIKKLAQMLEAFGFDAQKVIRNVIESSDNAMWISRSMSLLKDFQDNQVKRFIQTPMSGIADHLSDAVRQEIPGGGNPALEKEFFRHLGFLVMTINGLASDESLGKKSNASQDTSTTVPVE